MFVETNSSEKNLPYASQLLCKRIVLNIHLCVPTLSYNLTQRLVFITLTLQNIKSMKSNFRVVSITGYKNLKISKLQNLLI